MTRLLNGASVELDGGWFDSSEAPAQALASRKINPPTHKCQDDDKTMQNQIKGS